MEAVGVVARLDVRGGVAFAERLFDFILDVAGDGMTVGHIHPAGNHDVKIDPVVSAAVTMTQLVIAADGGRSARGAKVGVQNGAQQQGIGPILLVHQARGAFPEQIRAQPGDIDGQDDRADWITGDVLRVNGGSLI